MQHADARHGKPIAVLLSGVLALAFLISAAAAQPARDVVTVLTGPRTLVGLQDASDAASAANPTTRFVRDLLDAAAVDMEFSVLPWSRVLQRLGNEANVLAFYVIRTPLREELYEWIGMIQPIETYLYTLRGKLSNPPATLEQARDFRIGVARRSATADFLEARGFENLYYLPDVNRAPFLISRNRIDLSIFTASEVRTLLARGEELGAELEPLILYSGDVRRHLFGHEPGDDTGTGEAHQTGLRAPGGQWPLRPVSVGNTRRRLQPGTVTYQQLQLAQPGRTGRSGEQYQPGDSCYTRPPLLIRLTGG